MSLNDLYNVQGDILRIVRTTDSMGGFTEVETVLHNNWKCRINWSRGTERIQFNKDTYYRDAKVYGSILSGVTTGDRFKYDGTVYEIVNVTNPDNMNKYMVLEIRLVD